MELLKQRIQELNRELTSLEQECTQLNLESREWLEKRNSIQKQIKGLVVEAADFKGKRDMLNKKVRYLKGLREQAKMQRRDVHTQIFGLREKLKALMERRPLRNMQEILKEINSLDWRIQTMSLTLEEEKSLVDRVRVLEAHLLTQKQIQELKRNLVELKTEEGALEAKAKKFHEELSELAEQSQELHERMLEVLNKVQAFRVDAENAHQKYVEIKRRSQELHRKRIEILQQIESLKQDLRRTEEKRQAQRNIELLKELEERALKKLNNGERLTWEEYKVLAERGIV